MTDEELDRALAAAVNVEHAPDFLARVRGRVAQVEPVPWLFGWRTTLAGAAVVAIVVLAVAMWPRTERVGRPERDVATAQRPSTPERIAPPAPPATTRSGTPPARLETPAPRERMREKSRPSTPAHAMAAPRAPEVLITSEDARALRLLAEIARQRGLPAEVLTKGAPADREVALPPIEIPHVVVEPLPEIARLEGDRPQ